MIEITTNYKELKRKLTYIAKSQLPYATANALTSLAFEARKDFQKEFKSSTLDFRKVTTLRSAVGIEKARKSDWPFPFSVVGIREKHDYLIDHVKGATRPGHPTYGRAIPNKDHVKRTATGRVPKRLKPKNLLSKGAFVIKAKKAGNRLIVKRERKKQAYPLKVFYFFRKDVKIKDQVDLEASTRKLIRLRYRKIFGYELGRAIRTSR